MSKWIALLRGINVGGKNRILMADLREALSSSGLEEVQTYIQSGNLIFSSRLSAAEIRKRICATINTGWNIDVPVLVIKASELARIQSDNPYESLDPKSVHLTLLGKKPAADAVKRACQVDIGDDQFQIVGKCVYVHCPSGYAKTKIHNNFFEQKLGVLATSRNWKTVCKLVDLSQ